MENNCYKMLFNIFLPLFYLAVWFVFIFVCRELKFFEKVDANVLLGLSFLVMFFGMITKSTSWSVGNKLFQASGDSKRHVEYSWHENWENLDQQKSGFTIKIDHDNAEVIKQLMRLHEELRKQGGNGEYQKQ